MKKIRELSTLCGIDACAIVYSPYESLPEVWPEDSREARRILAQFKRVPEMEQSKKMVNQESFIRGRIGKVVEQVKKLHKENRKREITHLMYQCLTGKGVQGLMLPELNDMGWLIDQNLKEIYARIDVLKKESAEHKPVVGAAGSGGDGKRMQPQWFSEWMGIQSYNDQQQLQMIGLFGGGEYGMPIMPFNDNQNGCGIWENALLP